MPGDVYIWQSM